MRTSNSLLEPMPARVCAASCTLYTVFAFRPVTTKDNVVLEMVFVWPVLGREVFFQYFRMYATRMPFT